VLRLSGASLKMRMLRRADRSTGAKFYQWRTTQFSNRRLRILSRKHFRTAGVCRDGGLEQEWETNHRSNPETGEVRNAGCGVPSGGQRPFCE